MAYNQNLADRIRERLAELPNVEEKEMMGGIAFMYNGKMCVGVIKEDMMCRIDPEIFEEAIERYGARAMDFTKRPMKGYVFVDEFGLKKQEDFEYWIQLCLEFNPKAKASKKSR